MSPARVRRVQCGVALLCGAVLPACAESATALDLQSVPAEVSASARDKAREIRASDSLLIVYSSRDVHEITQAAVPRDASGLIGRNREWGDMYAARFQLGTGGALRIALVSASTAETERDAGRALSGVEAGLRGMDSRGELLATVPISVSMGRQPSPIDIASGAAFYLGDACLGMLALEAAPGRDAIADASRRRLTRAKLVQSIRWLRTQSALLLSGDGAAPNRLLFDARAFLACGALADDSAVVAVASEFVDVFRRAVTADGWFKEGSGWDTSYQAVSLDIGSDVALLLPVGQARSSLSAALVGGGEWLASRVQPDGRVNSTGNARTCAGGESFFGAPKGLALPSVVGGLARVAILASARVDRAMLESSQRVSSWARSNPGREACFEL